MAHVAILVPQLLWKLIYAGALPLPAGWCPGSRWH